MSRSDRLDDGNRKENIEIKARVRNVAAFRRRASEVGRALPVETQVDTYFHCPTGRLKLREIVRGPERFAQLISYQRADTREAKSSHYRVASIVDSSALKATLSAALGTWSVIKKTRQVYLYENVRIHLDEVEDWGSFMELEAVLSRDETSETAFERIAQLERMLGIVASDHISGSYSDLE